MRRGKFNHVFIQLTIWNILPSNNTRSNKILFVVGRDQFQGLTSHRPGVQCRTFFFHSFSKRWRWDKYAGKQNENTCTRQGHHGLKCCSGMTWSMRDVYSFFSFSHFSPFHWRHTSKSKREQHKETKCKVYVLLVCECLFSLLDDLLPHVCLWWKWEEN